MLESTYSYNIVYTIIRMFYWCYSREENVNLEPSDTEYGCLIGQFAL